MSKIVLGLDLGITSIGWALVNVDDKEKDKNKIIDSGVRIFTIAEHPKDGKSLALPRREARSARRSTKRKAQRMKAVKRLLVTHNIVAVEELEHLFNGNSGRTDVWQLRKEGLKRVLGNKEFARVIVHIAKHRGYASNRKSDEPKADDKEGKAVLSGITANQKALDESGYETIGELIANKVKKRNADKQYENSVARSMLHDEIILLFNRQKELGSKLADDGLLQSYIALAFTQRPLKSVADMVANCPFESGEKRAAQATYSFENFRALQKLKNIRWLTEEGEKQLSQAEISQAIASAKNTKTFTYKTLKKAAGLDKEVQFKGLVYFDHKTGEAKDPEKVKLLDFSAYQKMREVIEQQDNLYWNRVENDADTLDSIATTLSIEKDDKIALKQLQAIVSDEVAKALLTISFSGFGHLSVKALRNIVPFLEEGLDYDKACEKAGYDFKAVFKGNKGLFLPPLSKQENIEMTNPVVKRAVAQMRLVYNAIARKYGEIDAVHIEFTRDIKRSHKDRNDIKKAQEEFQERKEEARINAVEILGKEPSAKELLKFRLWQEQDGCCAYSGTYISPAVLIDSYATEVDHILPYSRSLDDSLNNKVLCLTKQNQDKGSQTPFEFFGGNEALWNEFEIRINANKKLKQAKKSRLLKKNFDESSEQAFRERNKNDTSYIARFVKNYIEAHIEFKKSKASRHVFTMNGMLTSQLRYKWGVGDKNRENHLHHAEDAILLAFATQAQVQRLSTVSGQHEGLIYDTKEAKGRKLHFEAPLKNFHEKVKESVENIFVSHMPRRKVTGAAHKDTVYSKMAKSKGVFEINNGLVENGEVKRIDVFKKDDKYHFIYLYAYDFVKYELKGTTIKGIFIDDTFDFMFSLFKNDLISLRWKDKQVFGYLKFPESDGRFNIGVHSTSKLDKKQDRYATGSLTNIQKYQVDALGSYVEVKSEKRQGSIKENWPKKLRKRAALREARRGAKAL